MSSDKEPFCSGNKESLIKKRRKVPTQRTAESLCTHPKRITIKKLKYSTLKIESMAY
jgi:hypothetical protein